MHIGFVAIAVVLLALMFLWYYQWIHLYDNRILQKLRASVHELDAELADRVRICEGNDTFIRNKQQIVMCLRDEKGHLYDSNTLTYVLCHELAHARASQYEHDHEWNSYFHHYLMKAKSLGFYDPKRPIAPMYCGVRTYFHPRNRRHPERLRKSEKKSLAL